MQPILLSQRDARWASIPLGTSKTTTIGSHGCVLTALAMKLGLTPDVVNTVLKAFNGFRSDNLIFWPALNEAFPGIRFVYRYNDYSDQFNEIIAQNLPCLLEVDATPIGAPRSRHWVLYVGNAKIYDPWDGREKTVSTYKITGFVLLQGEYHKPQEEKKEEVKVQPITGDRFYGLDPKNEDTFAALAKYWHEGVKEGKLISIEEHNKIVETIKSSMVQSGDVTEETRRYREFVAVGYNTVEDVQNAIKRSNEKNTRLLQDIVVVEKKNYDLATAIADDSKNTYTAVETALSEIKEKEELKQSITQIAQVAESKPTTSNIVDSIFRYKDLAKRFIDEKEKTKRVVSDNLTPVKKDGVLFFMKLFQLTPREKEVK